MLGEAARTHADAARYAKSYSDALDAIAGAASGGFKVSPGISVKLSALHPRYEWNHADEVKAAILPVLPRASDEGEQSRRPFHDRCRGSRPALNCRSTSSRRWSRTMHCFAHGWGGFGLALQAYQKRALPLCDWVAALARKHHRKLMVRLVKGAYWDSEDQGGAGRRARRLSGVDAQGRDRRQLPCLRQTSARRERLHLPGVCDPQCQYDWRGEGACWGHSVRVPAAPRHGEGCTRNWPSSRPG